MSSPDANSRPSAWLAPVLMLAGGASMYLGAGLAVMLFDDLSPFGVAWMRIAGAAIALVMWVRPGGDAVTWRR